MTSSGRREPGRDAVTSASGDAYRRGVADGTRFAAALAGAEEKLLADRLKAVSSASRSAATPGDVVDVEDALAQARAELAGLRHHVRAIHQSRAWRLAQRLSRLAWMLRR